MGKIFKDIEDLVEEGGKYEIPEVDNSGTQKDLSRENIPPEPGPTPQQGKDNPKPPDVEPQEFEERDRPPKTSEFDHRENAGERPGETSPFQHKQREDLRPDQTQPFQHQERDDRDISSPNRAGMEDRGNRPPKTEPFDHVSEARNRPDDAEKFDHVSESDRANIKKASKFPHQENAGERPDKTSPYGHEENEDLTPDKKTPYQHEQNQDLQPSETGPFEHEGKGLKPDETAPIDHEENKDLKPDKTSPFGHEQNEDLRPSETGPYEHEENEDLSPDETSPFQHEEDGDLTPSKTSPFEHEQDENLQPSETSSYQHEQDEDLQPPEDQPYQHEENKDLKPSSTQPFEHEQDENLQPSQTQAFEHEQDEDLQPSEDQPYQHEENEDLRPPSTQPFEHEQDEELQPPEDQTYQHEEDGELTPPEATRFEHEKDEELQPSETTPFEHEQNEELQPSEDQIYQHEEDEDLTPSDTQPFQHEEDEELRPPNAQTFEHTLDEELQPPEDEVFEHEEDESLRPPDTEPFGHEQDEELQPPEDQVFEHTQDEELQPPEDEVFEHEQDEELQPSETSPFEHEQDEGLVPPEDEVFDHEQDEELQPDDASVFEHQQDEDLQPPEDEVFEHEQNKELEPSEDQPYDHEQNEGLVPPDVYTFPLNPSEDPVGPPGDIVEDLQETGGEPLVWRTDEVVAVSSGPSIQGPTNEEIREEQISNLWEVGGFSLYPFEGGAPYGPFSKPGSSRARRRGSDTRAVPLQHTLDDQERLANFQTSPKGLVFTGKQFALQIFNPRPRTQIYNPVSLNQSAIPYVRTTRHLSADDGSLGSLVNSLTGVLKSSKFSDEIDENTLEWGYLINSIPVRSDAQQRDSSGPMASSFDQELSGVDFAQAVEEGISANIDKVVYRHQVKRGAQKALSKVKDAALSALGLGEGEGRSRFRYFLGTRANTGFYTRGDGVIVNRTDEVSYTTYNFTYPYIKNAEEVRNTVLSERVSPDFNFAGDGSDAFEMVEGARNDDVQSNAAELIPSVLRDPSGGAGLSNEVSERISEGSSEIRSSRNVATAFYGRSDGINSIAEYENLPKQEDDPSIVNAQPGVGEPGAAGMKAWQDTDEGEDSSFYQNKISEESPLNPKDHGPEVILHQGHSDDDKKSYGLPSYWEGEPGDDTGDLIDELGVIDLDSDNPTVSNLRDTYETDSGKEFEDLVPFKIRDKQNNNLLVFRSFITDISMNSNVQWESQRYLGRPEQFHIYTGADREMSVGFELHPFSHDGLKAQWQKLNYLQGLIYPSDYVFLTSETEESERDQTQTANTTTTNTGAYMIPPFLELTIGDIYRDQNGYINSLTISPESDTTWSMVRGEKLPEHITVDITYTIIEETAAKTGTKFFDTKAVPNPEA